MSDPLPDQATQTIAVLTICLVQALAERDPELLPVFQEKIKNMYSEIRDNSYFSSETLQAVGLVRDLLKS